MSTLSGEFIFSSENDSDYLQAFSIMVTNGNISDLKITTVMALHYFNPLVPQSVCIIENCYPSRNNSPVGEVCKEKIIYGDTSIGMF